ncbi:MAG: hypothetical protein LUD74_05030 [Tannerellaceae bacterium]|nr:hypothetical protein [Tannerellaceae bacterium]
MEKERIFSAGWATGQRKTFSLTLDYFYIEQQEIKQDSCEKYEVDIAVTSEKEGIQTLSWKYRPIEPGTGTTWVSILQHELMQHPEAPPFLYQVNPDGGFMRLANYAAVYRFLNGIWKYYCQQYPGESYALQWEQLKKCFSNRFACEQFFMQHVTLFHSAYGKRWPGPGRQTYHTTLPGNADVGKLDATTLLDSTVNATGTLLSLHSETNYIPHSVHHTIPVSKELLDGQQLFTDSTGQFYNYLIKDIVNATYELPSLWPVTIDLKRTTRQDSTYKKEEIKLEQI